IVSTMEEEKIQFVFIDPTKKTSSDRRNHAFSDEEVEIFRTFVVESQKRLQKDREGEIFLGGMAIPAYGHSSGSTVENAISFPRNHLPTILVTTTNRAGELARELKWQSTVHEYIHLKDKEGLGGEPLKMRNGKYFAFREAHNLNVAYWRQRKE